MRTSIRILKGFKVILNDFYKDFKGISNGILWRFNRIFKDFLRDYIRMDSIGLL